jgi:hypothetical protein
MGLSPESQEILKQVEETSGLPVDIVADDSLQVFAKVTMATRGAKSHVLRINPYRRGPDYVIAYECGFILRLYGVPPAERFEFAASDTGRREVTRMLEGPDGLARKRGLPARAVPQFTTILYDGIVTQLRSMPIGMRIDRWIYDTYPSLREGQASSLNEQQRTNVQVLTPQVRSMSPEKVYAANVSMNAAYALFADELFGERGYSVQYQAHGFLDRGKQLLERWTQIPPESTHDRELVDAWAEALGMAGWYRWIPYRR